MFISIALKYSYVEKFYKKYNQLKKELKEELLAESLQLSQSQNDTQGSLGSSCSTRPGSPERQVQRKSSVEFIRSPSQGSRMKASVFESKQNQRRLSAYEEIKSALKPKQYTEEQAFWLDLPAKTTSASQPTSTSNSFSFSQPTSNTQPSQRLVLGSSQPQRKKNFKQQKLFGRNPFQRALSSSQEVVSTVHPMEDPVSSPISSQTTTTSMMDLIPDDDEDDDMEGIEIVTHEIDPFRKYDPSLFHWEDPSFSIGPGFFSSVSPFYLIPMLNEPSRRIRVLEKLEKGTLGEVLEENRNLEQNLDQDIRDFIANNTEPLEVSWIIGWGLFFHKILNPSFILSIRLLNQRLHPLMRIY